jgi:undecaprenyl pyrophosphate phosphatase UppP
VVRTFILGIVQGLTEFLPISSSAHLSIVPRLLGFRTPELAFDVLLHFGTLAAVVVYFARDLWSFVLSIVAPNVLGPRQAAARRRQLGLLVAASIPAAIFGYLLQNWADAQTSRPLRSAVWLVATTAIMIAAELWARGHPAGAVATAEAAGPARSATATVEAAGAHKAQAGANVQVAGAGPAVARPAGAASLANEPASPAQGQAQLAATAGRPLTRAEIRRGRAAGTSAPGGATEELERLPLGKAVGIGVAQAVALIPGTSRSGVTISAGLFEGVSREAAARFSFLLSIPAILGAGILKLGDLSQATESPAQLAVGFVAAAVSGFFAVSFLIRLLRTHTLWPFIWYRLIAGGLFVVLLATVRG